MTPAMTLPNLNAPVPCPFPRGRGRGSSGLTDHTDLADNLYFPIILVLLFSNSLILESKLYQAMKENSKQTLKRVFDIIVTILTALITSLTASSCGLNS